MADVNWSGTRFALPLADSTNLQHPSYFVSMLVGIHLLQAVLSLNMVHFYPSLFSRFLSGLFNQVLSQSEIHIAKSLLLSSKLADWKYQLC